MPSIETIYEQTVLPLPLSDRIRLAEIIMANANREVHSTNGKRSALQVLETTAGERLFKDPAAVDEHLKSERDSWDD